MTLDARPSRPDDRTQARLSKFLALVLRHKAQQFDLPLDDEGYVNLEDLLDVLHEETDGLEDVTVENIEQLNGSHVRQRFQIDGDRIRATYGHSFTQPIRFDPVDPPELLYVGMTRGQARASVRTGIKAIGRQYVHLTDDLDEAQRVGGRPGEPNEVLTVRAAEASKSGIPFHKPTDGIFLSGPIPVDHLEVPEHLLQEEPVREVREARPTRSEPAPPTKQPDPPELTFGRRTKRKGRR